MEEWKQINNYPNYLVSNFGSVKNKLTGLKLGAIDKKTGYINVGLRNTELNNPQKNCKVHRLVAEHFLENFDKKMNIDHIDGNKENNHISNLRCVTQMINCHNRRKTTSKTSSRFIGVRRDKKPLKNLWRSEITYNYKTTFIGYFKTEEEAAKARDDFIIENNLKDYVLNLK